MERNRIFSDELTAFISHDKGMPALEWLADQMPGGFFIYRAEEPTELLYVNQACCDIFGCGDVTEFRKLVGNTFKGMVHPDDYDSIQTSIDDQIADSKNDSKMDNVVYRIIRKDGEIRWVDDYGHFAILPGYGPVYYVFIGDITESRIAAEEKERANSLAVALERAEQANIAKSAFLSNMSHEIRTPITAILGMNEMIHREARDADILDYSENIKTAGESLLGIISDILDFSKIETGKMAIEEEKYSLRTVIRDLYNLIRFRTEAKGLSLHFEIDPELPDGLIGDDIRIKQIITNLLTNAAKYTDEGSVVFRLQREKLFEDTVTISVSVTDTGIGIRQEDMEKLFEPFDRLDMKKTRSIEGSGLGLAITRQLLSLMDSELFVESEYGKGSRFCFTFEQKISDAAAIGTFDPRELTCDEEKSVQHQSYFTAPGKRILIVDDTPMNLQVIAGLLKRTRMSIDVASSGAECLDKFSREDYDLVFLDYRMPQMNGIETLEEIRTNYPDKYKNTPIISLTASAVSGDKERMLKAGFTDYLSKPVNIDEMESMMIKYLPEDSVIMSDADEAEEDDSSQLPEIAFSYPEIDAKKGLEYCGDADDYIFALETFQNSIDARSAQIENDLLGADIDSYILNVHSLKSTSGAIGATALSEKAKYLEMQGKEGNTDILKKETPLLVADCRRLRDIIGTILAAQSQV